MRRKGLEAVGLRARLLGAVLLTLILVKTSCFFAHRPSGQELSRGGDRQDLLARRDYLLTRLEGSFQNNALTPGDVFAGEWALGTLSMTAAALTNLAYEFPDTREDARRTLPRLIDRACQKDLRAFDAVSWGTDPVESLSSPEGHVGYLGHLNWMMSLYRAVGGDNRYQALHEQIAEALVRRMNESPSAHLETYPGEIFTSDNTVAAASIALYDQTSGKDHRAALQRYVGYLKGHLLDARTGLLVFKVDASGGPLGGPRGCGVAWNSFYLPFVDEAFAAEQYAAIKKHLAKRLWFGAWGIREYPVGTLGLGDVDSGPVIFELSTSGTGFAMAGARHAGDTVLLGHLLDTAELVGTTVPWKGKSYALAPLVGDAIVLAMRTARKLDQGTALPTPSR